MLLPVQVITDESMMYLFGISLFSVEESFLDRFFKSTANMDPLEVFSLSDHFLINNLKS